MDCAEILTTLWRDGIALRLAPDGQNLTVPAGKLTPEQRALVLSQKADLVAFMHEAHITTKELIEAAMRACNTWGDGPIAREQMLQDCLSTPEHLRAELRDHFKQKYPARNK